MNTLYNRIKDLAAEHNESLAQVERELGFSNGIISTWKKGNASAEKVILVAKHFNVSVDYLLGEKSSANDLNVKPKVKRLARKMDSMDDNDLDFVDKLLDRLEGKTDGKD
ncbi:MULTISPECIES: helix-turn-helix domain-containing protein [Lentilactobacillus]|uniref:helix-turn-helix domain-containing protein n=1 Tax=Lentilactobacillus TaxID=2767893 RepID=UPI0021A7AF97|nr:helix-turn-helix transcriptional regulator [Lentilactobacillus buchneri]MCT2899686.1 XRE family transcriptional regulator [Lentilactobacillus buchneri]